MTPKMKPKPIKIDPKNALQKKNALFDRILRILNDFGLNFGAEIDAKSHAKNDAK